MIVVDSFRRALHPSLLTRRKDHVRDPAAPPTRRLANIQIAKRDGQAGKSKKSPVRTRRT